MLVREVLQHTVCGIKAEERELHLNLALSLSKYLLSNITSITQHPARGLLRPWTLVERPLGRLLVRVHYSPHVTPLKEP